MTDLVKPVKANYAAAKASSVSAATSAWMFKTPPIIRWANQQVKRRLGISLGHLSVWAVVVIAPLVQDVYGNVLTLSDFFQLSNYYTGITMGNDFHYNVSDLQISNGMIIWGRTPTQLYQCQLVRECDRPVLEWYVDNGDITSCDLVMACFPTGTSDHTPVPGKAYVTHMTSALVVRGNNSYEVTGTERKMSSGMTYAKTTAGYLYRNNFHSLRVFGNYRANVILVDTSIYPIENEQHFFVAHLRTSYIGRFATLYWCIAVIATCTSVAWQAVLFICNVQDLREKRGICIIEGRAAQARRSIVFAIVETLVGFGALMNLVFTSMAMALNTNLTNFENYQLLSSMVKVLKLVVVPLTFICSHLEVYAPVLMIYRRVLSVMPMVALGVSLVIPTVPMSYNVMEMIVCSPVFPTVCVCLGLSAKALI